ncbi:sensor histidine kinase [Microlunatus parietis]|uniref:histidine kinase n=1 Tax=Microlunatus parietis TaxID=682979 RepID=A0A7Y9L9P8_9ACTN|nr:histidine kinase [Microlunatus parietis]NYE72014.1 signal transduction histidine kinase [Microlunatus parietis]
MNRWSSWPDRHPAAWDLVITAALALLLGIPSLVIMVVSVPWPAGLVMAAGLLAGHAAPLWRRRSPVLALIMVAVGVVLMAAGSPYFLLLPSVLLLPLALCDFSTRSPARRSLVAAGAAVLGPALIGLRAIVQPAPGLAGPTAWLVAGLLAVIMVAAWLIGAYRRSRLEQTALLADRAAARERDRIATEFHDIVGHSLAVIVAQARGAGFAIGHDPPAARAALGAIEDTGRAALGELRALVGVLGGRDGHLGPVPRLDGLPDLLRRTRDAGLTVEETSSGRPRRLGDGAELAAYRVVQEGLTNVIKHAGPAARATVELAWHDHELVVSVHNQADTMPRPGQPGGTGLVGLRTRVEAVGGRVEAGPEPGGGFRVRARFPYQGRDPA